MKVALLDQLSNLLVDLDIDPFTRVYLRKRLTCEGLPFLTRTLPQLWKSILVSLEKGYFVRPTSFSWKGALLSHFGGLLKQIFDRDGRVLKSPCATAMWRLRTLCEYWYKLNVPFTQEQLDEAENRFVSTEADLRSSHFDYAYMRELNKFARRLFPRVFDTPVSSVFKHTHPRFGPGSYAGAGQHAPFWLEKLLPGRVIGDYISTIDNAYAGFYKPYPGSPTMALRGRRYDTSWYSEVMFVPKDSRGPRVISKEPLLTLKGQMSFFGWMTTYLEDASDNRINFRDQSLNRSLAQRASITRGDATLDLKDASDRVSSTVVRHVFNGSSIFRHFLQRRTEFAKLPSGRLIRISKLSGMGSGLTFPTMALLIYLTVCFTIITYDSSEYRKVVLDARARRILRSVYVYGDDLIVPTKYLHYARSGLSKIGLMLNEDKCFSQSNFRESCGGDFFNGQDISPVRLRLTFGCVTHDKGTLTLSGDYTVAKLERHCRELVMSGHLALANYYYSLLEKRLGPLPYVTGKTPVLGRYTLITPSYPMDKYGQYESYPAYIPCSVNVLARKICPYKAMASSLMERVHDPLDFLDAGGGSDPLEVSKPREVRIRKMLVSTLRYIT